MAVSRAYLARADVGDGENGVVLALRADGADQRRLVDKVGTIFASIFNARQYLEIVFVSEAKEDQLQTVCRPLFER